jgi:hypothetical protein
MVRVFIEALLGEFGRNILNYYEAHALPINLIVVTYGMIMLMSWLTLIRIYRHIVILTAKQIHLHSKLDKNSSVKAVRKLIDIPYKEAVDAAPFPLVASQIAIIPVPKSISAVQKIIDEPELVTHALAVLNGANPRRLQPSYKMMWKKELIKKKP